MIHNMYFYLELIFTFSDVIGLVMFQAEIISVSFQPGKNKLSFKSPDWGGLGGGLGRRERLRSYLHSGNIPDLPCLPSEYFINNKLKYFLTLHHQLILAKLRARIFCFLQTVIIGRRLKKPQGNYISRGRCDAKGGI